MGRWRSRLAVVLFFYLAGFATAIYLLVPAEQNSKDPTSPVASSSPSKGPSKTYRAATIVSTGLHKAVAFAEDKAVCATRLIKEKAAQQPKSKTDR